MDNTLLLRTGMDAQQIQRYLSLQQQLEAWVRPLAQDYMDGVYDHIDQIYPVLQSKSDTEQMLFGAELVFVMLCAEIRGNRLTGRERELFFDALSDIGYKVNECEYYKKCTGIFVLNWYHGLLKDRRLSLGRLQFEVRYQGEKTRTIGDLVIKPGEPKIYCHIPSAGPLTQEACFASYRRAWEEYPEYRRNGVLPIFCTSWLFYPGLEQVFPPETNTGKFRGNFTMYETEETEEFSNCWRIFGMDLPEDLSLLPRNTGMQRRFADYIAQGGTFGNTAGVLLFDGEKIIQ